MPEYKPKPLTLESIRTRNFRTVKSIRTFFPDPTRIFTVLELQLGIYIETEFQDADGIVTIEIWYLEKKDSATATLISRERKGEEYNAMKSYPRDERFPLYKRVRIK